LPLQKPVILIFLTIFAILTVPITTHASASPVTAQTNHAPILIRNNSEFSKANGVTGGHGTSTDPYIIQGWHIQSSTQNPVELRHTTAYVILRNLDLVSTSSTNGTILYYASHVKIEKSSINSNRLAVSIVLSRQVTLDQDMLNQGNHLGGTGNGGGILIDRSVQVTFSNSQVSGNGNLYPGPVVEVIRSNSVRVQSIAASGDATDAGRILNSLRITIFNSNFYGGDGRNGLDISNTANVDVRNTSASGGFCGVLCVPNGFTGSNDLNLRLLNDRGPRAQIGGSKITIYGFSGSFVGAGGSNILISTNNVRAIGASGSSVRVLDNNVTGYGCVQYEVTGGIGLSGSNILVQGNTITRGCPGIAARGVSNAIITENNVSSSSRGIVLQGSMKVSVYHNNIMGNTVQASDDAASVVNHWDNGYPSGGNYWSDYTGVDKCSGPQQNHCPHPDGNGDTQYLISANSQDRYPLMKPFIDHD
jgi:parallel beta-helix repeat protein